MKKHLLILSLLACSISFGQTTGDGQSENVTTYTTQPLKYYPSIPADSTYTVTKNITGQAVPDSVLMYINLHRMKEDWLWRYNAEIEILIKGKNNL